MPDVLLDIQSIAAGGDGVARADNLVVFVPRTAPGDRAMVRFEKRGALGRGRLLRLERASPARVEPRCVHYDADRCGGCQIQHLDYAAQLESKTQIVRDAIKRIGHRDAPTVTMHPSEAQWRYRRKLTLELRRSASGWIAGLHRYDDAARIFHLRECPITREDVLQVWREILSHGHLLPRAARLRASVLALDDGAHLTVAGGWDWDNAQQLGESCTSLSSVWWESAESGSAAGLSSPRPMFVRAARADGRGASFAQVNERVASDMRAFVLGIVSPFGASTIVDAYCGTGELALDLAARGAAVTAVELDARAVAALAPQLAAPSRAVQGRVEDLLGGFLPADLVILNPPRTGVHDAVTAALNRPSAVRDAIVYVSCNPATLARDISRLPGFMIRSVDCFDMFPQTAHVETICVLVPERGA